MAESFPDPDKLPEIKELPDPLTFFDGRKVETPEQWMNERRPELKALFQYYMYGTMPEPPGITAREEAPEAAVINGKGRLKQIEISINGLDSPNAPKIHLALIVPSREGGPWPVFLALNKCGNKTILPDTAILHDPEAWVHEQCPPDESARGGETDFWCIEYLLDRGYGFATWHESNIDPDRHDFTDGIHPHYKDLPGPPETHWGTISAWAWGHHRAVDYLVTDKDVAKEGICITGHSRRGKTALLAGAFDERIAIVVPHQSGTGGAALSRDNDQETVERINRVFPHWFNDMFTNFNDNEARLPIDQHLLMSLVAPRPLLETAGVQDKWANYDSALRALKAADEVYEFIGKTGLNGTGMAVGDEPIKGDNFGELMQYRLDIKHTLNQDFWRAILDFADGHLE